MTQNQVKIALAFVAGAFGIVNAAIAGAAALGKIHVSNDFVGWLGVCATSATGIAMLGASPVGRVIGYKEDIIPRVPGADSGKHNLPVTPRPGTPGAGTPTTPKV